MINRVHLLGNLGKDCELKYGANGGTAYMQNSLATTDGFGDRKSTDWHTVTFFGKTAEAIARIAQKGSLVYVEGRISYETYEKDGQKRYTTKIIATTARLVGRGKESDGGEAESRAGGGSGGFDSAPVGADPFAPKTFDPNDIPF